VIRQAPLEVQVQLAGQRYVAVTATEPPHRLTGLRGFVLGERITDPRVKAAPPARTLGDPPTRGSPRSPPTSARAPSPATRELAAGGRTVLVSSHLMSEMAQTADHLVIIGRGRLLADVSTEALIESSARRDVLLRSPRAAELAGLIKTRGGTVTPQDDGALVVTGLDAAAIGDLAAGHGIAVHALVPRQASLEDAYLDLTGESTDFRGGLR